MNYLFTSESVSEGHPDKVSDQISDALLDQFLAFDANSKVAIETLVTTGQVVVAGEVKSSAYVDVQEVTRSESTKLVIQKQNIVSTVILVECLLLFTNKVTTLTVVLTKRIKKIRVPVTRE